MNNFIVKTLLKGISVVIPIVISVYVIYLLISFVETFAKKILDILELDLYFPGLGAILIFSIIFGIGLLMYSWLTRTMLGALESLMRKVPIFKSVYSPLKDMMSIMSSEISEKLGRPVFIKLPNSEFETLGFVTQDINNNSNDLPDSSVLVYVQMSYQIGGFTFIVPKKDIRDADLSVEEGIRWALTAGLSKS